MYAPNITDAQEDLGTSDRTLATFSLTIYVLGFGLGPLLFAPLSELYGRLIVYKLCLVAFLATTIGCGLSQNIEMLVAFRFLAGSFGAAPVAIGGAVVGDLFPVKERGTAMSVYQAGQIISAIVGPPMGGLIGSYLIWRWVFWIVSILVCGNAVSCTLTSCTRSSNIFIGSFCIVMHFRCTKRNPRTHPQALGLRTRPSPER